MAKSRTQLEVERFMSSARTGSIRGYIDGPCSMLRPLCVALTFCLGCGTKDVLPTRGVAEPCVTDDECAEHLSCAFERCHQRCDSDADCERNQLCVHSEERNENVCQIDVRCDS